MNGGWAVRALGRPGGRLAYRRVGHGPSLLLLHGTLSSAGQLRPLAYRLAARFSVLAVDRRGSGETGLFAGTAPGPIDVAVHVDDLAAVLAAENAAPALVVGHSFGGCVALELAARRPDLVAGVWAFEPPYAPAGPPIVRLAMGTLAERVAAATDTGGLPAAAETFLALVSGPAALAALSPSTRAAIRAAGASVLADAPLAGLDPAGLARISCPVALAVGAEGQPFYTEIADGLAARIRDATVVPLAGMEHTAPITHAGAIAGTIAGWWEESRSRRDGGRDATGPVGAGSVGLT